MSEPHSPAKRTPPVNPAILRRGGVRVLVGPPVFKTGEAEHLGLAGSIPVRHRQTTGVIAAKRGGLWTRSIPGG